MPLIGKRQFALFFNKIKAMGIIYVHVFQSGPLGLPFIMAQLVFTAGGSGRLMRVLYNWSLGLITVLGTFKLASQPLSII